MSIFEICIIGVGRLGGALALVLSRNGYKVKQLVTDNVKSAQKIANLIYPKPEILTTSEFENIASDILFICTQDSEIANVDKLLAQELDQMPYVFHTSGAKSSEILSELHKLDIQVGSFHPLVSISDPINDIKNFQNAFFCLEGDEEAVEVGGYIINGIGGHHFTVPTEFKALYHASAVMACGHLVTVISMAFEMFNKCGFDAVETQKILLPLIKGTITNLEEKSPLEALTGTFVRGDIGTLQDHIQAISNNMRPEILQIYKEIGLESLQLAKQKGIGANSLKVMQDLLEKK